ncbi:MoxR family ATPase [Paenibacillus thiaminolyticus]|uniref:MoxR family ATPase n=1 Tax=Paenibacillus thiaminolyticus TaxID=49283 RepID=A0AAP9DW54_PANTH|nr:MoxR family ATPase [Paenibacillus thiaminolyticus]MCY9536284.1 MoxR family ATPase [Paenibacillus thiaminolyticus]MCY9604323.1 MoxR family ATPase [Paenibacillus thiaminolyticus]MCY9609579.1 MoxR family ATPase [Paenibacillus thiaminolyticus]MCY9616029.1 MoxR family ATPase [Paenibacillus thiaminolyticus]MCY9621452.1 MoxR family ATPase [Paenibacillus thiaminolyticus]
MDLSRIHTLAQAIKRNVQQVIVGKDDTLDRIFVALFTGGHVLLEDVPGTGKTLLAKSVAKSIDGTFKRIQFTPDLLPTDLSGMNVYNQKRGEFEFRPGPVFTNLLLADEINRATPRTQSSLLECMEERQVSIDGVTMQLEEPFIVLATQNPLDNFGTFPLPEAQLDRFMLKLKLGYPTFEEGLRILSRFRTEDPIQELAPVATQEDIKAARTGYTQVHVDDAILEYVLGIVERTRSHPDIALGASPRASQALLRAVQAYAVIRGRDYVSPDDVKAMAAPVLAHRLLLHHAAGSRDDQAESVLAQIVSQVPVPAEARAAE